ncbi:SpoIID/LytB domain-containing protein [Syntrophaceticus schinkii]|jgi:stage II sporulation protein D|uniref:SpoIID/LytB domain protein n=1 Tax=Syntrophaceticus schinkii TaxID=499207 RepID=A0A0B7MPK0_9FIRM|nr:SpoIID/LytB domain-containing protein [Syntrophaceticus schinkii]MDD2359774.1 SpoIID/LytB domain-containing protein [Syntrophaceticus schinkii]MDD4260894.1 SpoIID/LytB domain-containing protein [Syntrophaceticus schinkii]MDD4674026.1 SpoIID/LytB domain-containing protein [Syntrophaceticus schinkii]CEO89946.1 SpoIID/LytB domain protein [Syntrophaceticus schinkii]
MRRIPLLCILGLAAAFMFLAVPVGCRGPAEKPLPKSDYKYREPEITLYDNDTGQKKRIKFEQYIAGVVAAEMEPSWPIEALAAQSILARTFTLHKIKYEKGVPKHGADASTSTEEFQAYDPSRITPAVREAVKKTRGKVIKYQGRYIRAWFHSNAGGKTATALEGLAFKKEKTPYIQSVSDPGQKVAKPEDKTWKASFTPEEVRAAVLQQSGKDPGAIASAAIVKKGPSGRAETVRLGNVKISGPALRLGLGPERMRSTLLDSFEVKGGMLHMSGRGYGHGVGMSQWGAHYMAKQGKSHTDIIHHYFRDVTIDKIWR